MLPPGPRKYLLAAIAGTPDVMEALLNSRPGSDPIWDRRPDPARFTLREVVAHLADWEEIFLDRMTRTREQDQPSLQGYDEGQVAIDHDYAHSDPHANLARFRAGRAAMVTVLRSISDTEWERIGRHTEIGPISLEAQAILVAGHDGYHTSQVAQWLATA
jgi:uncharacterized damage-inducible protein DinB